MGDSSCSACRADHYAPEGSGTCFPTSAVAGVLRIDASFGNWDQDSFAQTMAAILDDEPSNIVVQYAYPGSIVVNFFIKNPTVEQLSSSSSQLRRLSGNDKMILLYEWWLSGNDRVRQGEEELGQFLDFKLYARKETTSGTSTVTDTVVALFADSSPQAQSIFPPESVAGVQRTFDQVTEEKVTIFVDSSAGCVSPSLITALLSAIIICMMSLY